MEQKKVVPIIFSKLVSNFIPIDDAGYLKNVNSINLLGIYFFI